MTLKQKLQAIIDKNGYATSYMKNMMYAIEQDESGNKEYLIVEKLNFVIKERYCEGTPNDIYWHLEHCIGELVLLNNFQGFLDLNI